MTQQSATPQPASEHWSLASARRMVDEFFANPAVKKAIAEGEVVVEKILEVFGQAVAEKAVSVVPLAEKPQEAAAAEPEPVTASGGLTTPRMTGGGSAHVTLEPLGGNDPDTQ